MAKKTNKNHLDNWTKRQSIAPLIVTESGLSRIDFCVSVCFVCLIFWSCAKVEFENVSQFESPSKEALVDPSPPDVKMCDGFEDADATKWLPVGMTETVCPDLCPDGSTRLCRVFQEKEVKCVLGVIQDTGLNRWASELQPIQACPQLPQDCGEHTHDSKWWVESGFLEKTCETCPAGEAHLCRHAQESEMLCYNGVVQQTGKVREGKFIDYTNVCQPLPPKACGSRSSGSLWWETQGTETAACLTCWNSEVINCEYETEVERTCLDGVESSTGQKRRAQKLRQIGQCPDEPRDCGALKDGKSDWRGSGRTQVINCEKCLDGSDRQCLQAIEEEVTCHRGNLDLTGRTRPGSILDYVGRCPDNIKEKFETIVSDSVVGQADVLFLLDTSSSMFTSLNNLGLRFQQLTSAWRRIDWRIAITNTKVQKQLFESWALDGTPILLQKNDEAKPNEYIIKKSSRFAEDWFYWTVSRDPSDKGCNSQPYCMMAPSEPMRALTGAIRKRNQPEYNGFFRTGSHLVTIIITDEDEKQGQGGALRPQEAIRYFEQNLGSRMSGLTAMSVVIKPGDSRCLQKHKSVWDGVGQGSYGVQLDQFAKMTGGFSASLCDNDYGPSLSRLAESIRQELESIVLKETPLADSLKITFEPNINVTWTLKGKKVTFSRSIPAGTKISVRYLVRAP